MKTIPLCRFRYGLYKGQELAGVAVFGYPTNDRTISSVFGCQPIEGAELSRLVLLDEVPANGESFFVPECFRRLKRLAWLGSSASLIPYHERQRMGA